MSINFTVFSQATGRFLRTGSCPDSMIQYQSGENDVLIEQTYDPNLHYWRGFVREYNDAELTLRANKPEWATVWSNETMRWVDPRELEQVKSDKHQEINAARLAANRGTFTFAGKEISCDELSRSDIDGINGIVSLLGDLPPQWVGAWKTADNSYVPIPDVQTWVAFYSALVAKGTENFARSQYLKANIDAAETVEAAQSYVW